MPQPTVADQILVIEQIIARLREDRSLPGPVREIECLEATLTDLKVRAAREVLALLPRSQRRGMRNF